MDLASLAQFAEIVGSMSVLLAVVFGIAQMRQYQTQRGDSAAAELMRPFQEADFTRNFMLLQPLPVWTRAADLRKLGEDEEAAAFALGIRFETVGLLVFRGTIPYSLVEELLGGVTLYLWKKLEQWVTDQRAAQQQPRFMEWFQWLAERIAEQSPAVATPAYLKHKRWQPRS
jgi:hypothetical protein